LSHVHASVTYEAARAEGLSVSGSTGLGAQTALLDFVSGSQDTEKAYEHAMRDYRSSREQGEAALNSFRERMWSRNDVVGMAGLLHAYQDSFAPGYANLTSYDRGTSRIPFPGISHFLNDTGINMSRGTYNEMVGGSRIIIRTYLNSNPGLSGALR
jgi:hypothetical protein